MMPDPEIFGHGRDVIDIHPAGAHRHVAVDILQLNARVRQHALQSLGVMAMAGQMRRLWIIAQSDPNDHRRTIWPHRTFTPKTCCGYSYSKLEPSTITKFMPNWHLFSTKRDRPGHGITASALFHRSG
jgi:hypothetical protein